MNICYARSYDKYHGWTRFGLCSALSVSLEGLFAEATVRDAVGRAEHRGAVGLAAVGGVCGRERIAHAS